jgi:hypothetical protein
MPMSVRGLSSLGTERQRMRNPITHRHPIREREHVSSLVRCERQLVLGEDVGYLFKCQAEFVRVNELGDQGDVLAREPVIQPDEEPVQKSGDVLVVGAIHAKYGARPLHSSAAVGALRGQSRAS